MVVWEEGGGEVGTDHLNCLLGELGGEVMERGEEELRPPQEWVGEGGLWVTLFYFIWFRYIRELAVRTPISNYPTKESSLS